jgi:RNase P protein component
VQRNRIRRRLRAAVEDLAGSGLIGSGRYLVSPRRAPVVEIPYEELKCDLTTAFSKLEGR